jgi:hypothetical protein
MRKKALFLARLQFVPISVFKPFLVELRGFVIFGPSAGHVATAGAGVGLVGIVGVVHIHPFRPIHSRRIWNMVNKPTPAKKPITRDRRFMGR